MKHLTKILYAGIGILLAAAVIFTGEFGLSKQNYTAYNTALKLQTYIDTLGFKNFRLADYPVAFFDGTKEYVLYQGKTTTRKPILGNLAGTTWEVDGHYEIFVPTIKDMARVISITSIFESTTRAYGTQEHTATIWHEAFHAWQMTYYMENIKHILSFSASQQQEQGEEEDVWQTIDDDPAIKSQMEHEMDLLLKAYLTDKQETRQEYLAQYFACREKRLASLPEQIGVLENFYELSEGGASYVEARVYLEECGKELYNEKYIKPAGRFAQGTSKYYRTGLLKYLLMDAIQPEWKAGFDSSKEINTLLKEAIGS